MLNDLVCSFWHPNFTSAIPQSVRSIPLNNNFTLLWTLSKSSRCSLISRYITTNIGHLEIWVYRTLLGQLHLPTPANFASYYIPKINIHFHYFICLGQNTSRHSQSHFPTRKAFQSRSQSLAKDLQVHRLAGFIKKTYNLASTKHQKYKQHIKVEACIKSSCKDVIVPRPEVIMVVVGPIHYYETTYDCRKISCRNVAVEIRHCTEEDSCVPLVWCQLGLTISGLN